MDLAHPRGAVVRHADQHIGLAHQCGQLAAGATAEDHHRHVALVGGLGGSDHVGIIARVPLASGLLTGKFSKDTVFGKNDHRFYNRNGEAFDKGETFSGVDYELGLTAVAELKALLGVRIDEGLAGKVSGKRIGEILDEELADGDRQG